jgi:hypothetical protein
MHCNFSSHSEHIVNANHFPPCLVRQFANPSTKTEAVFDSSPITLTKIRQSGSCRKRVSFNLTTYMYMAVRQLSLSIPPANKRNSRHL